MCEARWYHGNSVPVRLYGDFFILLISFTHIIERKKTMSITEILAENARLYRDETALVEINPLNERRSSWREYNLIESNPDLPYRTQLSWEQFDTNANRFANLLLTRGIKKGTKVAILLMNCIEWLPRYFGILKTGAIAVPMNYRFSADEIKYCLELSDAEFLIFGPEFTDRVKEARLGSPLLSTLFFVGNDCPDFAESYNTLVTYCSSRAPTVKLSDDDYAAIYFSSGTTGFPKAILHKHSALMHSCKTEQNHHSQTHDDVFLCIPPLYHTGAKMHWFGSLLSGGKTVILKGTKPLWIMRAISEEKCTSATRGVLIPSARRISLISFKFSTWAMEGTVSLMIWAPAAASFLH